MNDKEIINEYQKLAKSYKMILKKHKEILSNNKQLKIQLHQLMKANQKLKQEIYDMSQLEDDEMTLTQFKIRYLTNRYESDDMPKKAGIYAYFNEKTNQLYIGQSVNMYNRLKQHFRRGLLKIDGHDSEFSDQSSWKFYVLEYINRKDKKRLDEREAYWIALGKAAVSDKTIHNQEGVNQFINALNDPTIKSRDIETSQTIKGQGELTNRTRGNNIRM